MTAKLFYLTTNPHKIAEARQFLINTHHLPLQIETPDFPIIEIQATTCAEVAAFSAKYAADKLKAPVLKSDTGLYMDALGGLPGVYNAYFDKQIGIELFLDLIKNISNRKARLEHCFAYCEPEKEPVVFTGGSTGSIAYAPAGSLGRWHDKFYIPDGETQTLSQLRALDYAYESAFYGSALQDFAHWYKQNYHV